MAERIRIRSGTVWCVSRQERGCTGWTLM